MLRPKTLMIILGLATTTSFATPGDKGDLVIYKGNLYQGMSQIELYQYCGRFAAKKAPWSSSAKENKWLTVRDHCIDENAHYASARKKNG